MRWIQKTNEPRELREWRARSGGDQNFGYGLMPPALRDQVKQSLTKEQGWLCAYTGRRVEFDGCHIEHIKAQAHCERGQDVDYVNLLACFPAPNTGEAAYGAHQKKDWPHPSESHLFVSPLDRSCGGRFFFNLRGEIQPANPSDTAAKATIEQLKLCHRELTAMRKNAIQGMLGPQNGLAIGRARDRLRDLEGQTSGRLEPFCFVLIQALQKHIQRLKFIRQSQRNSR